MHEVEESLRLDKSIGYMMLGHKLWHRVVWEKHYGRIPEGYVIHHIDGNRLNNELSNLRCLSESDHVRLHLKGKKLSEEQIAKYRKPHSAEHIRNNVAARAGYKPTEETRRKQSEAHKGHKRPQWVTDKIEATKRAKKLALFIQVTHENEQSA